MVSLWLVVFELNKMLLPQENGSLLHVYLNLVSSYHQSDDLKLSFFHAQKIQIFHSFSKYITMNKGI
jgi:hypothetical protein